MSAWNQFRLRLRALFHRRNFDRDIADELAFHLAMREQDLQGQGLEFSAARSAAHARFGNTTRAAETLRELRRWIWLEGLSQDLRFAVRRIRLNRGFTLGAILPLALAIACVATVFSLVDAILFQPTGVKDPARVAAVYTFSRAQGRYLSNSYPDFRDIRGLDGLLDSAAAYLRGQVNVRLAEGVQPMNAEMVTGDYFRAAGIVPALGRPLLPADDLPGALPVTLASYAFWENRYQRSPSIRGATVAIDGVSFTIVGVMPKGYKGMLLDWYGDPSFWLPLTHFNRFFPRNQIPDYEHRRDSQMFMLLARLRPDASISRFQAALDVLTSHLAADSLVNPDDRLIALPASQARFFPAYRAATVRFLWLLIAVSATALAIACFNLASLLLARAAARRQEISARLALGAGSLRIVRQLLIENAVLAACACAVALPVAMALTAWLPYSEIARGPSFTLDLTTGWRALGLSMAAGLLTSLAAGITPALRAIRHDIQHRPHPARPTVQDFFSAAQVACAMIVLAGAVLLAQNLRHLGSAPLGYETRGVLIASFDPISGVNLSRDAFDQQARTLLAGLRAQAPAAALAQQALPSRFRTTLDVKTDLQAEGGASNWTPMPFDWISDGYFELLHMPLISGRAILPFDGPQSQPVIVINRSAAKLLWPGENPLGRRLRLRSETVPREVVGLVEDSRYRPLGEAEPALPYLFLPLFQRSSPLAYQIHVRAPADPLAFAPALRRIIAGLAPDAPLYDIQSLDDYAQAGLSQMRVAAQAAGAVSLLGVLLAVAGIFASGAYRVARRKKEIAIHLAIGAEPRSLIRSFAVRGLSIGIAGACLGLIPASWGVTLLRASIPGLDSTSLALYLSVAALLASAACAAAFLAARRIARIQPADVLRVQ